MLLTSRPPGITVHFFFDRLLLPNINNMVKSCIQKKRLQLKDVDDVMISDLVFQYTAGVPRFVTYTLWYLEHISKTNGYISKDDITNKEFFGKLFNFVNQDVNGHVELSYWKKLEKQYQNLYLQLVIDAILAVPYSMNDVVSVDWLKIDNVNLLQIIWAVGVYTAKSPQYSVMCRIFELVN